MNYTSLACAVVGGTRIKCTVKMAWNNEMELNFIEMYQMEPVLWDPSDRFHKDKKYLHDAWVRISEQVGLPIAELKKKRDSLMASYRGHLRKIKNSVKSGAGSDDIYKPIWFAFDIMNSFLEPLYECKNTTNTENQNTQPQRSEEYDSGEPNQILHENATGDKANNELGLSSFASPLTQRRRKNPPELIQAENNMKEAISNLNRVINKNSTPAMDDCDLYGKMLANKLRKLSDIDRLQLMHEIDGLYLKKIRRPSYTFVPAATNYVRSPYPSPRELSSAFSSHSSHSTTSPTLLHIPETTETSSITAQNLTFTSQQIPASHSVTVLSDDHFTIETSQPGMQHEDILNEAYYKAMQ